MDWRHSDNYNGTDSATQNTKTAYHYDSLDRLTQVTDPSNLNTTYSYDGLSDATGQQSPDTGATSRTFDAAGNVLTRTDAKGITATMTYDALNRPLTVSYPDSTQNITYAYDEANSVTGCSSSYPIGRLTRIVESSVTTVYCYDAWGRVIQKQKLTATTTTTTGYSYTAAGRLSGIVYADGSLVSYVRDGDGRIQSISATPPNGTATTVVSGVTYQPFGPVSGYTLGNGQPITRTYDANYRLTDLTSPAFSLHVARDTMGAVGRQHPCQLHLRCPGAAYPEDRQRPNGELRLQRNGATARRIWHHQPGLHLDGWHPGGQYRYVQWQQHDDVCHGRSAGYASCHR